MSKIGFIKAATFVGIFSLMSLNANAQPGLIGAVEYSMQALARDAGVTGLSEAAQLARMNKIAGTNAASFAELDSLTSAAQRKQILIEFSTDGSLPNANLAIQANKILASRSNVSAAVDGAANEGARNAPVQIVEEVQSANTFENLNKTIDAFQTAKFSGEIRPNMDAIAKATVDAASLTGVEIANADSCLAMKSLSPTSAANAELLVTSGSEGAVLGWNQTLAKLGNGLKQNTLAKARAFKCAVAMAADRIILATAKFSGLQNIADIVALDAKVGFSCKLFPDKALAAEIASRRQLPAVNSVPAACNF